MKMLTRKLNHMLRGGEEGSALVEMALVSAFVFLPMLFAIFQVSYGLFVYGYVSQVSRSATRYAAVRGALSCSIQSNFTDCNLGPGGSTNPSPGTGSTPLENYVRSMAYPGIDRNRLTVTSNWYTESFTNAGGGAFSTADWSATACTSGTCNNKGDAVRVTVRYQFPLHIPFWGGRNINIASTSQMMINE